MTPSGYGRRSKRRGRILRSNHAFTHSHHLTQYHWIDGDSQLSLCYNGFYTQKRDRTQTLKSFIVQEIQILKCVSEQEQDSQLSLALQLLYFVPERITLSNQSNGYLAKIEELKYLEFDQCGFECEYPNFRYRFSCLRENSV